MIISRPVINTKDVHCGATLIFNCWHLLIMRSEIKDLTDKSFYFNMSETCSEGMCLSLLAVREITQILKKLLMRAYGVLQKWLNLMESTDGSSTDQ